MLITRLSRRSLWGVVSICLTAGVVIWGCAPQESPQPQQPPADLSRRLTALEECVARAQGAVKAAADAGISAGPLAPMNSGIADAQDALDESTKLAQQGKQPEAVERVTKALEECDKLEAMVTKARQDAVERRARAHMATEADTRIGWTVTCVDDARQALRKASAAGVKGAALTTAQSALDSAETALKQGRELLAQNDPRSAIGRLEAAQADCQTARDTSDKAVASRKSGSASAKPRRGR
jgi:hypothetical protein